MRMMFIAVALIAAAAGVSFGQDESVPPPIELSPERAARFERFADFEIRGVCGVRDLARLREYGVNTVRGYTIPSVERTLETLDEVRSQGMKLVVSEWMPNQGENTGHDGTKWNFDYDVRGDRMVERFTEKVEGIGDHPAILMWGLGNEVHLDEPYLRVVNRMSEAIHERFPLHLTSLTMVNAKPEHIEKIKAFAPDLDLIGVQSYSPGAVRGAIRNMERHWRKPFYMSEFNGKGPWNFGKTDWGTAYDELTAQKVADLHACYDAIEGSELCLGSTIFMWGYFSVNRASYFALLLSEHPDGPGDGAPFSDLLLTPRAEVVRERFTGVAPSGNRAPWLTVMEPSNGGRDVTSSPGASVSLRLAGTDADGDRVRLVCWVLDSSKRRPKAVAGPFEASADGTVSFAAPAQAGEYLVMAYAMDDRGGAAASTVPMLVK